MKLGYNNFKSTFNSKLNIDRHAVVFFAVTVGILFIASIILGFLTLVLTVENYDLQYMSILFTDLRVVLLNVLPVFLVMLILYFLLNRIWISFITTGVVAFIIAEINKFKVMYRGDPFVFEDLMLISEAQKMTDSYKITPDLVSLLIFVVIIALTIVSFLFFKRKLSGKWSRITGVLVFAVLLVCSCNALYFNNPKLHNSMWHPEFGNKYNPATQNMSRGVVYSFIKSIPDAFLNSPDGYKERDVKEFLTAYNEVDIPEEKRVHTICIMMEAYNDFSNFDEIEFNIDPYANYRNLKESSYSGKLFTNIFAGNTIVTERSFITGFGNSRFLMNTTPSYAWYFKSQGYYTEMMHPYYGWFYNRDKMNVNFGFDNFLHYDNYFKDIPQDELENELYWGKFISDCDFFKYITDGCSQAIEDGKKYFNFSVTFQNHGPYTADKVVEEEYLLKKTEYDEADYNVINNYLSGVYQTDQALLKLRNYIDECEEPVVLILFGDHNPHLGNGDEGYHMLDININLNTPEGAKNYYGTDYLFYANDSAKEVLGKDFSGAGNTVSPMMLMAEYFEYLDLKGPAYLNYLLELKKDYPVINIAYVGKEDNYQSVFDVTNDDKLNMQKKIEYYLKTSGVN